MKTRVSIFAAALMGAALWAGGAAAQISTPSGTPSGSPFLDHLRSDLQLTTSQENAWQSFQQAYRVDPQDLTRERDAEARMPGLNGPQRMDLAISMAEQDLAGMRQRSDALKAFYASLSADQQHVFDHDTLAPAPQQASF